MKHILAILLAAVLSGCVYHSQTKDTVTPLTYSSTPYRSAESIGKLRRLAIMPIKLKVLEGQLVPRKDKSVTEEQVEGLRKQYRDACMDFMANSKGYEVIAIVEAAGEWRIESVEGSLEGEVLTDLADVRKNWMDEDPDEHDPGLIQQIGQALQVDGLMVLSIRKERVGSGSWQAAEITLMFLTMDAPLFYSIASPDVGIWIYESASGNLVWSQEAADASKHGHDGGFMPEDLPDLLLDLENAVPAQLIQ